MAKKPTLGKLMDDLVAGRETPELLGFMAGMERALAPSTEALNSLLKAIAADLRQPTDETRLAMHRAKLAYEQVTEQPAIGDLWDDLVEQARKHNDDMRKRPPAISEILVGFGSEPADLEYEIAGMLGGVRGIWHRLWSSISSERWFGKLGVPQPDSIIPELRAEFESAFGRALTEAEWGRLVEHAHRHCDEVLTPMMAKHVEKDGDTQE